LLSHHHVFVLTNQIFADTAYFAESADVC